MTALMKVLLATAAVSALMIATDMSSEAAVQQRRVVTSRPAPVARPVSRPVARPYFRPSRQAARPAAPRASNVARPNALSQHALHRSQRHVATEPARRPDVLHRTVGATGRDTAASAHAPVLNHLPPRTFPGQQGTTGRETAGGAHAPTPHQLPPRTFPGSNPQQIAEAAKAGVGGHHAGGSNPPGLPPRGFESNGKHDAGRDGQAGANRHGLPPRNFAGKTQEANSQRVAAKSEQMQKQSSATAMHNQSPAKTNPPVTKAANAAPSGHIEDKDATGVIVGWDSSVQPYVHKEGGHWVFTSLPPASNNGSYSISGNKVLQTKADGSQAYVGLWGGGTNTPAPVGSNGGRLGGTAPPPMGGVGSSTIPASFAPGQPAPPSIKIPTCVASGTCSTRDYIPNAPINGVSPRTVYDAGKTSTDAWKTVGDVLMAPIKKMSEQLEQIQQRMITDPYYIPSSPPTGDVPLNEAIPDEDVNALRQDAINLISDVPKVGGPLSKAADALIPKAGAPAATPSSPVGAPASSPSMPESAAPTSSPNGVPASLDPNAPASNSQPLAGTAQNPIVPSLQNLTASTSPAVTPAAPAAGTTNGSKNEPMVMQITVPKASFTSQSGQIVPAASK